MRTWVVAIVAAVVVMVAGCGQRQDSFPCTDDASCGVGGKCEPGFNLCSFSNDAKCGPGGRSFGDLGGANSGQCVGSTPLPDGGMADAPPDARLFCYGNSPFTICLAAAPTQPLMTSDLPTIDTTNSTRCIATVTGGSNYCVIAATTINVDNELRATGTKPLVLLASDMITMGARVDVGSHRGATPEAGAGAPTSCAGGTPPANGGGGAGGSMIGLGGTGGNGNNGAGAGGTPAPGAGLPGNIAALRGGCPGQDGQGGNKGIGGNGGGTVLLIAVNKILLAGGGVNAAGEGGTAATDNSSGGGGGGAGGMIVFDAPMIMGTGLILASGGGGGEGAGTNTPGNSGLDPSTIAAAAGGAGRTANGGDGGDGSINAVGAPGLPGMAGTAGGGGGGGGAGLVKAPAGVNLGGQVSPPATP